MVGRIAFSDLALTLRAEPFRLSASRFDPLREAGGMFALPDQPIYGGNALAALKHNLGGAEA
jgi:hypothetical protein